MTKNDHPHDPETGEVQEQDEVLILAEKTLTGDLRDFILDRLKNDHSPLPWNMKREHEQRELVSAVEVAVARTVRRAVEILAADGRKVLRGTLKQIQVKDGIKAQIDVLQSDPLRHDLIDHTGGTVFIALANVEDFEGARAPVKIEKDQGSILEDDPNLSEDE